MPTFKTAFRWAAVVTPVTLAVLAGINRVPSLRKLIKGQIHPGRYRVHARPHRIARSDERAWIETTATACLSIAEGQHRHRSPSSTGGGRL